jgi:hypothetical protein
MGGRGDEGKSYAGWMADTPAARSYEDWQARKAAFNLPTTRAGIPDWIGGMPDDVRAWTERMADEDARSWWVESETAGLNPILKSMLREYLPGQWAAEAARKPSQSTFEHWVGRLGGEYGGVQRASPFRNYA